MEALEDMTDADWLRLTGIKFKPIRIIVEGGRVIEIERTVVAPSGYEYTFKIRRPAKEPDADDGLVLQPLGGFVNPSREQDLKLFAIHPPNLFQQIVALIGDKIVLSMDLE